MATLGNFFTSAQISALKSVANSQTLAEKYAPSLLSVQHDDLYAFAVEYGVELDRIFWVQLEELNHTSENVVVYVENKRVFIEHMNPNNVFAHHIGQMLKRDIPMFFVRLSREISWDNWKMVYSFLVPTGHARQSVYDMELSKEEYKDLKTIRRRNGEFYDLARPIRDKKGGRMRISFEEAYNQRVKAAYADHDRQVFRRANKILQSL